MIPVEIMGLRVEEGWLREGSRIRIGRSSLRFTAAGRRNRLPLSNLRELGTMVDDDSVFVRLVVGGDR